MFHYLELFEIPWGYAWEEKYRSHRYLDPGGRLGLLEVFLQSLILPVASYPCLLLLHLRRLRLL